MMLDIEIDGWPGPTDWADLAERALEAAEQVAPELANQRLSASVRPRMNAIGATSITPLAMCRSTCSGGRQSYSASYSGRRYGSTFSFMSPGRKPSFSPASTAGRLRMRRCTLPVINWLTACATAR